MPTKVHLWDPLIWPPKIFTEEETMDSLDFAPTIEDFKTETLTAEAVGKQSMKEYLMTFGAK